ncbi:MAG: DUF1492 domain-containing protein [Oscillospiraceae bacterium]|nr:DUF1492 domain-containing protein [Oscillospiraceae bacterium]
MVKAEEYLRRLRGVDGEINAKLSQCEVLREMAARASSINLNLNISVGNRGNKRRAKPGNRFEDCVAELLEIENDLKYKVHGLASLKCEALKKIDAVENSTYRTLLILRYINDLNWEQIADRMNYTRGHITQRLHPRALAEFEKIYGRI